MNELIKMYIYRMTRKKGLYISLICTVIMLIVNLKMMDDPSLSNLMAESGSLMFTFTSIYTAIFFCADHSSGFVRNYAGAVADRSTVIGARAVIAVTMNMLFACVISLVGLILSPSIGDIRVALTSIGCMLISGIGCSVLAVFLCEFIRKSVPVIVLTIFIGSGIAGELLATIFALLSKGKFLFSDYIITGKYKIFSMTHETGDAVKLLIVTSIYIIAALTASIFSIKKRDAV